MDAPTDLSGTDELTLTGLRVFGHHGVLSHERRDGQEFIIDVVMHLDVREAAGADDVDKTVHYGEVAEHVAGLVAHDPVDLIETVAARIARDLLARYSRLRRVTVTVHKPNAPIPVPFSDVSVRVTRARSGR
ncbi:MULTISPECIES: dihydroneopterin aldolase [Microbacterium]|jgi:dihydroneopterin aldolase|uniref:dihydroneopterin aldolase n=1 Tax=Microbacterium TaxID=33882 RepID=UPI000C5615B0|nr:MULTISPECIES: dihydroneopterin aldolase [Microbacterium]MAY49939.1 dihydroneopterin aldolase [Microbacterium sp.]HAS32696.1 dihydroneopterin aldolase [Microbacterium sp.]HBR87725.1 dihydroneopterin aldolase [Microbacterium sp.]HBS74702.1 dihydroneopterin aldolase [Microbacterium sp.]|tara:strand:+ start:50 stop:445 length:396 start_codon:yes stop_codon:yes gene_type:complete